MKHRIIQGVGVRIASNPLVEIINFHSAPSDFSHAWLTFLNGTESARILSGEDAGALATINGVEAGIKGVPLSGDKKTGEIPLLQLPPVLELDVERRGYIAAELTYDPKNNFSIVKVELVQCASPHRLKGDTKTPAVRSDGAFTDLPGFRARMPVAMLRKRLDGTLDVFQIAYFPAHHRAALAADRKTAARHFFW